MSLTAQQQQAIIELYTQVVIVRGDIAYDKDGNEVSYDLSAVTIQAQKNDCKDKASDLLYKTDWTSIADVANPVNNPYLTNQAEFIAWRSQIRQLAVNPVENPTWPTQPTPVWSNL
jgi:hypothetical protein